MHKAPHMIMVDYAFHNLVDIKIYRLVVVYLEKKNHVEKLWLYEASKQNPTFPTPPNALNLVCISSNISSLKVPTSNHINYLQNVMVIIFTRLANPIKNRLRLVWGFSKFSLDAIFLLL